MKILIALITFDDIMVSMKQINVNFINIKKCKEQYIQWLKKNALELTDIIELKDRAIMELDLSKSNLFFKDVSPKNITLFKQKIQETLQNPNTVLGIGGYLEQRGFYTAPEYAVKTTNGTQWRDIHLGIDIWAPAKEPIYCPLDATVFSAYNNQGEGNYGPTIILEHQIDFDFKFYTLYGHLTIDTLDGIQAGQKLEKGHNFAWIGDAPINGNWPPHLHFQVILDMLEYTQDFRGVCLPNEVEYWSTICPDPSLFFKRISL